MIRNLIICAFSLCFFQLWVDLSVQNEFISKKIDQKEDLDILIEKESKKQGIPSNIIKALVLVESSGNPDAIKFERSWKNFYHKKYPMTDEYSSEEEYNKVFSSIGLMQISYVIWGDFCELEHYSELFDSKTNLKCGISILKNCIDKTSNVYQCLIEYNCGSRCSNVNKASMYANKILIKAKEF